MAAKRAASTDSISVVYFNWRASMSALRCWLATKLPPSVSKIDTSCGNMPGTDELTKRAMAADWVASSIRPGCKVTNTEALGRSCSRTNAVCLGTARCTLAALT